MHGAKNLRIKIDHKKDASANCYDQNYNSNGISCEYLLLLTGLLLSGHSMYNLDGYSAWQFMDLHE